MRPLGVLAGAAGQIRKASIIAEETSGQGLGTRPLGILAGAAGQIRKASSVAVETSGQGHS